MWQSFFCKVGGIDFNSTSISKSKQLIAIKFKSTVVLQICFCNRNKIFGIDFCICH